MQLEHCLSALLQLHQYISILDLTPGFNGLSKDNCKTRRETFQLGDLVLLVLEVWQYIFIFPWKHSAHDELSLPVILLCLLLSKKLMKSFSSELQLPR